MDNVPVICRLCLNLIEKDSYAPLQKNNSVLQSLNLISFSTIKNLQLTKNPVICKCCSKKLSELATFKESIIANEFKIQCNKKSDPKSFLCSISEDINKICRLCLKVPLNLKDLLMSWKDSKVLLHNCNIHLNNDIAIPSKICLNCDNSLKKLGEFIVECTYNEKKIYNSASEKGTLDSNQLIELFKIDGKRKTCSKISGKNNIIDDLKSNMQVVTENLSFEQSDANENLSVNEELRTKSENLIETDKLCNDTTKSEKCCRTYRSANYSIFKHNVLNISETDNILKEKLSASTNNIDIKQSNILDVTLGSEDDYNPSDNGLQDLSDILDGPSESMNNEEPNISIEECNDDFIIMNFQLKSDTSNNTNVESNNFREIEFEIDLSAIVKTGPEGSNFISTSEVNETADTIIDMRTESKEVNITPSTSNIEGRKLRNKRKASISGTQDIPVKRKNLKLDLDQKNNEDTARAENNVEPSILNDEPTSTSGDKETVKNNTTKKSTSVTPRKVGRPAKKRGRPPKQDKQNTNKSIDKEQDIANDTIISSQDECSSSCKLLDSEDATCSNSASGDNDIIKKEVVQTNAKPFEVTIIRRNKRTTNKAELDKTWQKLTGKSVGEPEKAKEAPEKVKKKRGRKPNPNKVVPVKPEYLVCSCCPFKTIWHNSFVQHQYIHNVLDNVASFKCKHCHFKTSNEELLKQHETTHSAASLIYKCIFCDYTNHKKKISIMNHILRHDDKDVATMFYCAVLNQDTMDEYFECFQCDFQNPEEAVMPDHVIDHSRAVKIKNPLVAKFVCGFCNYRTKTEELLERHKELKHSKKNKLMSEENMVKIKEEAPEDGLFKCELCSYKTFHKRSLSNHKSRKHFRKPSEKKETGETYYCAECSYTTNRKVNLARHALVHKTKRNMEFFECTHCYFETKHRRSYTRHMEVRHQVIV